MKKFKTALIFGTMFLLNSCNGSFSECQQVDKKELMLILDLTDPLLFEAIEKDLNQNFGEFMQRTELSNISTCSEFKLSMAPVTSQDNLNLRSHYIGIPRKGLSKKAESELANPTVLLSFMNYNLNEYRQLSHDPEITTMSVIANVIFKTLANTDPEANSVVLIFSDLVENNGIVNFYRRIPPSSEIPEVINRMVETSVQDQLRRAQGEGLTAKVIVVLKPEPSGRPNIRDVRRFWTDLFDYLKLDVQFIDNLTNAVDI